MSKIEKKRSCILAGTVIGTLILLFILQKVFVFFQLGQHASQADLLMKKSELLIDDLYRAKEYLRGIQGDCNSEDMERLQYISNKYRYIYDAGIVNRERILCTAREGVLEQAIALPKWTFAINSDTYFYHHLSFYPGIAGKLNFTRAKNVILVTSPFFYQDRIYDDDPYLAVVFRSKDSQQVFFESKTPPGKRLPFMESSTVSSCSAHYSSCVDITDIGLGVMRYGGYVFLGILLCAIILALMVTNLILDTLVEYYSLENRLKGAILRNRIMNRYQPIVDVGKDKIVGAEVLVRWDDDVFGAVSPEFFIPVVEKLGYSQFLTFNMLNNALQDMAPLISAYHFTMSINVGSVEVINDAFIPGLNKIVDQFAVPRSRIKIEVTERTDVSYHQLSGFVSRLGIEGYKIAIDDFGTGTSNLHLLPELNFDDVKIDKFYIERIADPNFRNILRNMVFYIMAQNKNIIFEGVESAEDLRQICEMQPHPLVQGWYFYQALAAGELIAIMPGKGIPQAK